MSNPVAGVAVCRCTVIGRPEKVDVQSFWETELDHLDDTRALHHHIRARIIAGDPLSIIAPSVLDLVEIRGVALRILDRPRWRRPLQKSRSSTARH